MVRGRDGAGSGRKRLARPVGGGTSGTIYPRRALRSRRDWANRCRRNALVGATLQVLETEVLPSKLNQGGQLGHNSGR